MAITTNTFSRNSGYAQTDVIYQMEEALTWLGWHGGSVSGIVTGINAYSGGGTGPISDTLYSAFPSSGGTNIGIGSTASFYLDTDGSGNIEKVLVNRPGAGYVDGDSLTISAGDQWTGDANVNLTVYVDESTYGSSSTFYSKDVTESVTHPWGVLRKVNDATKVYGDTYYGFQVDGTGNRMLINAGSSFMPYTQESGNVSDDKAIGSATRFAGEYALDVSPLETPPFNNEYENNSLNVDMRVMQSGDYIDYASSPATFQMDLNVYKSGIDPNFAVFAYREPYKPATSILSNNYSVFFLHNFTTNFYDLDYVFQAGCTYIERLSSSDPGLRFRTCLSPHDYSSGQEYPAKRSAGTGYMRFSTSENAESMIYDSYMSSTYPAGNASEFSDVYFYHRDHTGRSGSPFTPLDSGNTVAPQADYNAVIKGIPLSAKLVPCPYYLPDDFVLINFDYASPDQNIQQGDTITISGSEIYTIITADYNQTTRTRGIAFCARTT